MSEVTPQSQHFLAPWAEEDDIPAGRRTNIEDVSLAFAIASATELLYILSGRKYRSGRSLIRPTQIDSAYGNQSYLYPYSSMSGYGAAWGFAAGWSWTALGQGWWQSGQDLSEVVLQGPVRRINQILVDGSPLQPTDYTLYDGRRLVRNVDATGQTTGAWPWNQQLQLPLTEPGTWCVDEETEILTSEGWRRYDELAPGDEVYALDTESMVARFEPLLAVNVFPAERRRVRRIETTNFSSLSTVDHRWPVWQAGGASPGFQWRTSERLTTGSSIFRSAPRADAPQTAKWLDSFVELVAWYWCEGSYDSDTKRGRRITIVQSKTANPHHVASIRSALISAFPDGWNEYERQDGKIIEFRLKATAINDLLGVTGPNKAPTPTFIRSLTGAQLRLLVERCLDGDGTRQREGRLRRWFQVDEESIRTFEMVCALAGLATHTFDPKTQQANRYGRAPSLVTLLDRPRAKPLDAVRVSDLSQSPLRSAKASDSTEDYEGIVWCPSTPSRTWLARRRGTVYFTGNSIDYEWGQVPPHMGKMACIELAVELARSISGDDYARLPARVLNVATQGVSVAVGDPLAYIREDLIGLPVCDLFLRTYNKGGLRRRTIFLGPNSQLGREMETFPPIGPSSSGLT